MRLVVGSGRSLGFGVVLVAVASLLVPAQARAKGPEAESSASPPGITVTGIGFARPGKSPDAVTRAVRDARRRASAVAGALGIAPGQIERVEMPEISQFGEPRPCGAQGGGGPSGCHRPRVTASAATVTFAIVGGASGEGSPRTAVAQGASSVPVRPRDRQRSASIKRALLAARRAVAPAAALAARRSARAAARASGLALGPIVSIAETKPPYYYGPSFYDPALGSFGPGRFCGFVRRPIVRRDPDTGVRKVVRRVRERRCFVSDSYSVHFEIRYEVG